MTGHLQQAFAEIQKLPDIEQDAIAALILEELAEDRKWDESFANSQDKLKQLADKARQDIADGRVCR